MLRWRIGIDSPSDDESNPVAPGMPLALYDDPANSQQCGNSLRRPHIRIQDASLRSARTRRGRCAAPRQNADRTLRYSISPSFSYRWLLLFGARDGCALSHHPTRHGQLQPGHSDPGVALLLAPPARHIVTTWTGGRFLGLSRMDAVSASIISRFVALWAPAWPSAQPQGMARWEPVKRQAPPCLQ